MKARKLLILGLSLLLVSTLITAYSPAPEEGPIVIGGLAPLSAPGAYQAGTQMYQAMKMAVAEINEAGGILGRQLELVIGDTEGLPEKGTAVTERLITQDKVVGLTGIYHSGVALASMEISHKYGIPTVYAEPWADDVTGKGYPEIFRIAPTIEYFSRIPVNYYLENGWKTFVFVNEETDYGRLQSEATLKMLVERGIKESDIQTIFADPATEDFTPILQRIAQNPPDLLSNAITGIGTYRFIKQACELGLAPTAKTALEGTVDIEYPEYWENVGECGKYTFFSYVGLPKPLRTEKTEAFIAKFKEVYNQMPGAHAMEAYDALYILVKGIEAAGTTEPKAVIAALEQTKYQGVLGEISFKYGSHNPVPPDQPKWAWHQWMQPNVYMIQYIEANQPADEANIVWPRERATGPLYTKPAE